MADQEKKAQWIMRLTVCLCGILILGKAGQARLAGYAKPEHYMLHEAVALLAEGGQQLFLPAVTAGQEPSSLSEAAMEQMAAFFGWNSDATQSVYVEDEYTRQELIDAGRGGSLQAIREENKRQSGNRTEEDKADKKEEAQEDTAGAASADGTNTAENKAQRDTADSDTAASTEETGAAEETPEKADTAAGEGETPADSGTVQPEDTVQSPEEETTAETASLPSFQQLVQNQEKMSPDKLLRQFFVVDPVTKIDEGLLSYDVLTGTDLRLSSGQEGVQIVIYHTHSQETFADSVKAEPETTIVGVGTVLEKELTKKGYRVLHLTDTFDVVGQTIDRNKAYTNARKKLKEVLAENPSVQVLLDIHRDGVPENKRLVTTVNGRPTAQIMFFNGLSRKKSSGVLEGLANPYLQENLAFSYQTEYLCDLWYPGFSRCIYLKAYRYNLDLLPRSMLVEVGAQTNTVEEAKNAMYPLADVLYKLLQGTS